MTKDFANHFLQNVRDGKVPGFSVDPNNPATSYDAMSIYAPKGSRVRFTGYGGYDREQAQARATLLVDGVYTVERTIVRSSSSIVYLQEFPGKAFNTVMFENERRLGK